MLDFLRRLQTFSSDDENVCIRTFFYFVSCSEIDRWQILICLLEMLQTFFGSLKNQPH